MGREGRCKETGGLLLPSGWGFFKLLIPRKSVGLESLLLAKSEHVPLTQEVLIDGSGQTQRNREDRVQCESTGQHPRGQDLTLSVF